MNPNYILKTFIYNKFSEKNKNFWSDFEIRFDQYVLGLKLSDWKQFMTAIVLVFNRFTMSSIINL